MEPSPSNAAHSRVHVLALHQRDAQLICELLSRAGIVAAPCSNGGLSALPTIIEGDCLILTEELLTPTLIEALKTTLDHQPPWSDFPVLLLTAGGEVSLTTQKRRSLRDPLGNLVLLERPIRPETLISTVQNALRARRRQYQIRDQVEQYKRAEEALRKSEKLAVAGRLASSIAHEINNPLESVTNLLYLMRYADSLDQVRNYLDMAEKELARVSAITTHTLRFYRQSSRPAAVDICEVLESAIALYYPRLLAAGVAVERRFRSVPAVHGMPGELRQVFSNLIGNSLDAMRGGGRLLIRVQNAVLPARGVRVTIADTGTGIPREMIQTIFEPFITTKGETGTGLGLWISMELIQKHGGHIRLRSYSLPDRSTGTVFTLFLPSEDPRHVALQPPARTDILSPQPAIVH